MEIRQYDIVAVNLDAVVGDDVHDKRPCLVVSPDEMNKNLRTIVVAPLTASSMNYPTRFEIELEKKVYWVVLDQIWTIDRKRVSKEMGRLPKPEIKKVKSILKEIFID